MRSQYLGVLTESVKYYTESAKQLVYTRDTYCGCESLREAAPVILRLKARFCVKEAVGRRKVNLVIVKSTKEDVIRRID